MSNVLVLSDFEKTVTAFELQANALGKEIATVSPKIKVMEYVIHSTSAGCNVVASVTRDATHGVLIAVAFRTVNSFQPIIQIAPKYERVFNIDGYADGCLYAKTIKTTISTVSSKIDVEAIQDNTPELIRVIKANIESYISTPEDTFWDWFYFNQGKLYSYMKRVAV